MVVLDEEPYFWLLLEEEGVLYLNAFCSHSAADYPFLIVLDENERRLFEKQGRSYLTQLAQDIHYSAPAVRGSRSRYKARGLTPTLGNRVEEAWTAWQAQQDGSSR
ncbi:hypothetical protein [Tianweitania sp.]|uniref:hypothetical protein n=1 Tax=Tianweitania sp. TaxID=2021634 RepID=UPI00289EA9AB|nr:hypothetical protein [Tianweitania sp.]